MDKRKKISEQTQLTMHIASAHFMSLERYVILTQYGGKAPKCACGYCTLLPRFSRGKFSRHAVGHNKFDYLERAFIKKNGRPQCKKCNKIVKKFHRGKPLQFCSHSCGTSYIIKKSWKNPEYRKIKYSQLGGRLSKLHQRVRDHLKLSELGFKSEQMIDRYVADEVNFETKTIIEINGDYVHANPNIFKPGDMVTVRSKSYTALQKWEYDKKKKEALETLGYRVIVIWESDDWNKVQI